MGLENWEWLPIARREIIIQLLKTIQANSQPVAVNVLLTETVNKANQPLNRQFGAKPVLAKGERNLQASALPNIESSLRCIQAQARCQKKC